MNMITCTLLLLAALSSGHSDVSDFQLADRIDALVKPYVDAGDFMGVILVAKDDSILFEKGYGSAVLEHDVDNGPDTLFRVGSISKQFTAAAILLLEEGGKLSVEDSLAKHVTEYPYADKMTLHQLMSHRAGVPSYVDFSDYELKRRAWLSDSNIIEWISAKPLAFEPGSQYAYSNSGYVLLRFVIERASGMSYGEFLQKRIFTPAGMTTARVAGRDEIAPGLATGYTPGPGPLKIIKALAVPEELDLGASGIVASTRDLLKWHQALEKDLVLTAGSKEKMQTSHGNAYGYGVSVHKLHGHNAISHDGRTDGYTTYYVRLPEENMVIAVFSNVATIARDYITSGVAAAVFDTDYEPPAPAATAGRISANASAIAGTYKFPPNWQYRIFVEDGHVYLSWMGREPTYLSPLPDGDFFMRIRYERLSFPMNESGVCEEALYYWGENPVKCPRIKQ